jgi:hypothetical protein
MKLSGLLITALLLYTSFGCTHLSNDSELLKQIENELNAGELKKVVILADSLKKLYPKNSQVVMKSDSLAQIADRIADEFCVTGEQVASQIEQQSGKFSPEDQKNWEEAGWLEWRMINGEKKYFRRAASNLILVKNFQDNKTTRDSVIAKDPKMILRKDHTESIIKASDKQALPVIPVEIEIIYTITVKPDAVPAGEAVRCWLPYPKENNSRQSDIYLLGVSNEDFYLAPNTTIHRSIYLENKAEKGLPLIFQIMYSYKSFGQYFDPSDFKILPYKKNSALYREYTSEQLPQICFTGKIKHLADSITGPELNPYQIVRKIYYWFSENITWANAPEYSIIPNIPEYVLRYRRGDCGMQTFLFMSMLRYKGIPVKWQSGWKLPPDDKDLHDWCEVYYEGTGWVPVDIFYGLQCSENLKTKEFYISGIDSYRLIVNDGISGSLYPKKKYIRSEPFDFQRGEVEWSGGNLYFDKWDYEMKINFKKPEFPVFTKGIIRTTQMTKTDQMGIFFTGIYSIISYN